MKTFFLTPLVIFLLMIIILLAKLIGGPDNKEASALIGKPLPAFTLPAALDGTPGFASTDIKGKYSLLNIFGSWCITCQIEHPFLMKLKAKNIPIYGIDWNDKPENLAKYIKENGNPYQAIGVDAEGKSVIDLGVTGAPETFLISPEGIIIFRYAGPLSEEIWILKILPLIEGEKK